MKRSRERGKDRKPRQGKSIICIPCEVVQKAGGKELKFKSIAECARAFGLVPGTIYNALQRTSECKGFYIDYL